MPFGSIVSSLGTAIGALETINKAVSVGLDFNKKVHYKKVLAALKELYFLNDGTLSLLRKLANNEPIQTIDFQKAATRYFRASDDVYRSLQYLEAHCTYSDSGLSIRDTNDIGRLLDLKLGARSEIDEFIFDVETAYPNLDNEAK